MMIESLHQRWNRGHDMLKAKAKDTKKFEPKAKTKDRPSRGQGQKCLSPRRRTNKDTGTSALQKKCLQNFFQAIYKILTIQKIELSSSRGQGNFRELDLRGQGQGLQNVFSRTPPLLYTKSFRSFIVSFVLA